MEDKQKTSIANELFFIGKLYLIGFIIAIALCLCQGIPLDRDPSSIFLFGLILVGIGYVIRLIKWVFKWKS